MRVVAGTAKGIKLLTPEGLKTRPTTDRVKEAMFSILQFELEGRRVLDLFAGTGQLGIEALSRGAKSAVFIDANSAAVKLIRENLKRTNLASQAQVYQAEYDGFLKRNHEKFDVILLDPPYGENFLENAMKIISEIDILSDSGIIMCEKTADKTLEEKFGALVCNKEYRYGNTSLALYRKGL